MIVASKAIASAICIGMIAHSADAAAGDKQTPVDLFTVTTAMSQYMCHIGASNAILSKEIAEYEHKDAVNPRTVISKCTGEAVDEAKPLLRKALAFAARKPAAVKAIKDYYLAWVSSLNSLSIETTDTKQSWNLRQEAAERQTKDLYSRIELEMGL